MARATKEQSEITGRAIKEAAVSLFAERGYAAVGLEEVAAVTDVTRGAVYHHFRSKRGLFEAVAADLQGEVADAVLAAATAAADPWAGLVAGCRAFLETSVADRYRRILLLDAPAVLDWSTWRGQDADASGRHLVGALDELRAAGVITVRSAAGAATLLSGAMNEAALRIAEAPDRASELATIWPDLHRLLGSLRSDANGG